jgi:hypothetical protein
MDKFKKIEYRLAQFLLGSFVKKEDQNNITIDNITLSPEMQKKFAILSEGDKEPFFFLSRMGIGENHPVYDGTIMTKEWAESFVNKLDSQAFPGSIFGHIGERNFSERVENQLYVVGGVVDGEYMYLKNYIIPGETERSKELRNKTIREMKAGLLSTSIVSYYKAGLLEDEEGILQWFALESIKGERNDIVEHDLTGSDADIVSMSAKNKLIEKEREIMADKTYKELIQPIVVMCANGQVKKSDVAAELGLDIVTDEHRAALKTVSELKQLFPEGVTIDQLKNFKASLKNIEVETFKIEKEKALKAKFVDSEILEQAEELFTLKAGSAEDCQKEVDRIAELKIIKNAVEKKVSLGIAPHTGKKVAEGQTDTETYEG